MKIDSYIYTNQGGRQENEDAAGTRIFQDHGIFVVADGLGGHRYGRIASDCIVASLEKTWTVEDGPNREEWLKKQIEAANEEILDLQKEYQARMKSTVVALSIDGEKAIWAHSGDSRLYYLHNNRIAKITEDHSVAYKKYKAGEITKEEIGKDEDQASLLRCLGGIDRYEPDLEENEDPLESGDGFLLCSDGVWEYLYDEEIEVDFLKADTAKEWANLLLLRIIDRIEPSHDNLTLLTVILE